MMRAMAGGGLFGLSNTLSALTRSPLTSALSEAHRMARLHLEAGGSARSRSPHAEVDEAPDATEFELPPDVDPVEVALAIEAKMRGGRPLPGFADPLQVLERRAGGRVVVRGYNVLRLGDGRYDRGRQFMHALINAIRAQRTPRA
jgi:hypothetical protein